MLQYTSVGVVGAHGLLVEAEPVHYARSEVLDEDVCVTHQPGGNVAVAAVAEVQYDAALVPVKAKVIRASVGGERRTPSPRVVAVGALHLDDVGAQIAQGHRDERAGKYA